jgi:membrane protein
MAFQTDKRVPFLAMGRRVLTESMEDDVLDLAASVSYYFLFALFPGLLFLATLLSELHMTGLMNNIVATLNESLPREAGTLVQKGMNELLAHHPAGLLSLGTVLLIYSASQGFTGLMNALNTAYEVPETRPWWRRFALAVGLTFSAGLMVALALAVLLFGQKLLFFIAGPFRMGPALQLFWPLIRWGLIFGFLILAATLMYRYVPNVRRNGIGTFKAAISALILWLAASAVLATYANNFANYATIYGSLGAVIALMLWFYVLALALLVGAEIHHEVLRARGIQCRPGYPPARRRGEEPQRKAA